MCSSVFARWSLARALDRGYPLLAVELETEPMQRGPRSGHLPIQVGWSRVRAADLGVAFTPRAPPGTAASPAIDRIRRSERGLCNKRGLAWRKSARFERLAGNRRGQPSAAESRVSFPCTAAS